MSTAPLLDVRPEVQDALQAGRPVVALESTLISHGLPWPVNLELSRVRLCNHERPLDSRTFVAKMRPKVWMDFHINPIRTFVPVGYKRPDHYDRTNH